MTDTGHRQRLDVLPSMSPLMCIVVKHTYRDDPRLRCHRQHLGLGLEQIQQQLPQRSVVREGSPAGIGEIESPKKHGVIHSTNKGTEDWDHTSKSHRAQMAPVRPWGRIPHISASSQLVLKCTHWLSDLSLFVILSTEWASTVESLYVARQAFSILGCI
jgi:hypothetical protein